MPNTWNSKEFQKYLVIKRLENDKATLLEKLVQNNPNNLYAKNSRKLHKNPFPKSAFFSI